MLKFGNLKTKRQIKNALLDMFNLKKVGSFWFKDKNGILSIRINSSRGKVFLNINLPQEFKVSNTYKIWFWPSIWYNWSIRYYYRQTFKWRAGTINNKRTKIILLSFCWWAYKRWLTSWMAKSFSWCGFNYNAWK